jgi:sulfur-carrier protein
MTILKIPSPLRAFTEGAKQIEIEGKDVGEAIEELVSTYPALKNHLIGEDGELRQFVNLFVNSEDVRYLDGNKTILRKEDQLMIIPSIAGGSYADDENNEK